MFVKVLYDEIVQAPQLEYDLYTMGGEKLFGAGHALDKSQLETLKATSVYRSAHDMPQTDFYNHEGHVFRFEAGLTDAERTELAEEQAVEGSLYDDELSHSFEASIGHFWKRLEKGAPPDIALCEVVRDRLIAQVTNHIDEIRYLSQIRVRDEFTYSHILDVTALSISLAIKAGFSKREVKEIGLAAILHDLGKLLIPESIMFKPSRLTEREFQIMQLHPGFGYKIIVDELKLPEQIARPALEHQEMYGGGGYPQGLKGDEIHPYSHVVKIADVYDALTSKRPYKESIPSSKALKIMLSEGDKSFHPELLAHFVELCNYKDHSQELTQPHKVEKAS